MSDDSNRLIGTDEAAKMLGLAAQTLVAWRMTNKWGLRYIRVGRMIRYRVKDIQDWIESRACDAAPINDDY